MWLVCLKLPWEAWAKKGKNHTPQMAWVTKTTNNKSPDNQNQRTTSTWQTQEIPPAILGSRRFRSFRSSSPHQAAGLTASAAGTRGVAKSSLKPEAAVHTLEASRKRLETGQRFWPTAKFLRVLDWSLLCRLFEFRVLIVGGIPKVYPRG